MAPGTPSEDVHILTPGDHFSPRTGSAIPAVVDGLARATPAGRARPRVLVASGTYPDRYDSATIEEYRPWRPARSRLYADVAASRIGLPRRGARREWAVTVARQGEWDPAYVFGHNAPQLMPSVDRARHEPVLWAHNDLLRTYSPAEAYRTLRTVAAIVCVSEYIAGQFESRLDARLRGRVKVVRNGVDATTFRPGDEAVETGPLRVVFAGRMIPDKGAHVLVEALELLGRYDIEAVLVGSAGFDASAPPTRYETELRVRADRLGSGVRMLPFQPRPRLAELLRGAEVAVVPSVWPEPGALTLLEGMASGAVLVASRVGGIPEYAADDGLLFAPGDAHRLAEILAGFADDRAALARGRRRARQWALAHTWARTRRDLDHALGR